MGTSRADFKGDYLSFTFDGVNSSTFNIVSVINGDRSNLDLSPPISVDAIEIANRNGAFYSKTTYKPRDFNISFAFDGLTEVEVMELRTWLKPDKVAWLIFDELPYKKYKVVISDAPKITYLGFDENSNRVIKGEGSVNFRCYDPFARSVYRTLNLYGANDYPNKSYWADSSGLKETLAPSTGLKYDIDASETGIINLYNPGDIETPLFIKSFIPRVASGVCIFTYNYNSIAVQKFALDLTRFTVGTQYVIDGERKIIYSAADPSIILNYAILAGDFIKIKPSRTIVQTLTVSNLTNVDLGIVDGYQVFYDYLYF